MNDFMQMLDQPKVSCSAIGWKLFGLSASIYNANFSLVALIFFILNDNLKTQRGPKIMSKKQTATKKKLINSIAQNKNIHPNDARQIVQAFLDKIIESLANGDRLEFRDFGIFEIVERKQKIGRNPKKADVPIVIPARLIVKFTPGKKMDKTIKNSSIS